MLTLKRSQKLAELIARIQTALANPASDCSDFVVALKQLWPLAEELECSSAPTKLNPKNEDLTT